MSKHLRQIPDGWTQRPNGDYAAPKTARQHNTEAGVGELTLDAGGEVKQAVRLPTNTDPVPTEPLRVEFEIKPSTDEEKLNKTEKRWLAILRERNFKCLRVQAIQLKLGDNCRYCPDFSAIADGRMTFWEVKGGFIREDAWLKLKIASRLYPEFDFVLAQYKNGAWTVEIVKN